MWSYHDVNADVGGYVERDRAWRYASVRGQAVSSRLVAFPVKPFRTETRNVSLKGDVRLGPGQRLTLFANSSRTNVPNFLDGFGPVGGALQAPAPINLSEDSTSTRVSSGSVGKAEWQWVMRNAMFATVRAGHFAPRREERPNGSAPRFENVNTLVVSGGNRAWEAALSRPQLQAFGSYLKGGWYRLASREVRPSYPSLTESQDRKQAYPGDVLHVLRETRSASNQPEEVYLFATPSRFRERALVVFRLHRRRVGAAWKADIERRCQVRSIRFVPFRTDEFHPAR